MKFIPSRDLRIRPGQVWRELKKERELIITSNGQPVALMTPITGDNLEEELRVIRSAWLRETIRAIQHRSVEQGIDKMTMEEIDEVIRKVRTERRKQKKGTG